MRYCCPYPARFFRMKRRTIAAARLFSIRLFFSIRTSSTTFFRSQGGSTPETEAASMQPKAASSRRRYGRMKGSSFFRELRGAVFSLVFRFMTKLP